MDEKTFRTIFPEFAEATIYPSAAINFWLQAAANQININAWGKSYAQGMGLYVAHQLSVAGGNKKGGIQGAGGVVASKSVGGVSVSYDTASSSEKDAGYWNLTNYGRQYWRLARLFGAGVIQL